MSFTALYGPLRPLKEGFEAREGVKITDPDALDAWASHFEAENILADAEIKERTDLTDYPTKTWKYLLGFRTWNLNEPTHEHDKSTLGAYHNIERLGYAYGGNFTSFWAGLSLATEPFEMFHPLPEHGFAESGEDIIAESTERNDTTGSRHPRPEDGGLRVAHVRSQDGTATVDIHRIAVVDVVHTADEQTVELDEVSEA